MKAQELIEKLRTSTGTWIGDETAMRILSDVLEKSSRAPAVDRKLLVSWINYLTEFNSIIGAGCDTPYRLNRILIEMQNYL